MFTGIIEEQGVIEGIKNGEKSSVLRVGADRVLEGTLIGDSISLNGVCLTVTKIFGKSYECDVMAETLRYSSLGDLKVKDKVNLERALALGSRLGGHIVSGHIDGCGVIEGTKREDNAVWVSIKAPENIMKYVIKKGSIAIDGVSLTVAEVEEGGFKVSLIPHTAKETGLLDKKTGDRVNLENDVIGKYVEKMLGQNNEKTQENTLTKETLFNYGFI
ncbi:MAG: riboflavin synthase [Eubacterium sp.]|nr:riboflavin synthase [Eubacterium sp.]